MTGVRTVFGILMILVASTAGCGARKTSDRDLAFVSPTDGRELVGVRRTMLGNESIGAWVDARNAKAFAEGHIPGAINLPFADVTERHQMLDEYDVLIVYGETWNDPIAHAMSKRLLELGHGPVQTLRGGLKAWTDAGYDVEASPSP